MVQKKNQKKNIDDNSAKIKPHCTVEIMPVGRSLLELKRRRESLYKEIEDDLLEIARIHQILVKYHLEE